MHLACEGLCKSYGRHTILDDITLDFSPGSINILMGPNGAGKTTLLRLLDLLEKPDRGEVLIDGRPVTASPFSRQKRLRQRMGFVFQSPMFLDGTVRFNLEYALKLQGKCGSIERIDEILQRVGLTGRLQQSARLLSGGEKQRLQLARVMLLDPDLYLLDEPTSSLDPLSAREVERIVGDIARSQKTVILSTHNLLMARSIGERFFFFSAGRLLQQGARESIFSRPVSTDIAEFSAGGNILDGVLAHHAQGCRFHSGDLCLEVTTALPDGPAAALIRPEDLLLSVESLHSSARNSLPGRVAACQDLGIVQAVTVEVRGKALTVFVTRESLGSMGLRPGSSVWMTCKATSIHIMKV